MEPALRALPIILPILAVASIVLWSYSKLLERARFEREKTEALKKLETIVPDRDTSKEEVGQEFTKIFGGEKKYDTGEILLDAPLYVPKKKPKKNGVVVLPDPPDSAPLPAPRAARGATSSASFRLGMQVFISLVVLAGAMFIIISQQYDPKDKHWAYGSAGTILGFWLKR